MIRFALCVALALSSASLGAAELAFSAPTTAGNSALSSSAPYTGKGVNYMTGLGMNILNCTGSDQAQISKDMVELRSLHVQWVRIETSMTAISGLPTSPACPPPVHEFDNLVNLINGIRSIGARPVVNILGWHYPPTFESAYRSWLNRLVETVPEGAVFEIGNEENLSNKVESYPGHNPDEEPYGWDFDPRDLPAGDGVGACPADQAKRENLSAAVARYVAWLNDSHSVIKAASARSIVVLGGLSSWQPVCSLERLGALSAYQYADALGYHPYPRHEVTPQVAANTLNDPLRIMNGWKKRLPIWVTEYGFSTNAGDVSYVNDEATKASDIASEYKLLRLVRELRADVVFTHWPEDQTQGFYNHGNAGILATKAVKIAAMPEHKTSLPAFESKLVLYFISNELTPAQLTWGPDLFVNVEDEMQTLHQCFRIFRTHTGDPCPTMLREYRFAPRRFLRGHHRYALCRGVQAASVH